MKILSNAFNIYYPQIENIREYLFKFEKNFQGFAKPFTLIPLPEGFPPEIPRIVAVTEHGHTDLSISIQNAVLTTQYDTVFQKDLDKCFKYMYEKIETVVFGMMEILTVEYLYSGLTTVIVCEENDDPVERIKNTFIKAQSSLPIYDASTRITYIKDDNYYFNIEIYNERSYKDDIKIIPTVSVSTQEEVSHDLQILLDINDRHGFNLNSSYRSDKEKIGNIFDMTKTIITEKIDNIIGGKIEL